MQTQNYIDGRWKDSVSCLTTRSYNPSTGEAIAEVVRSTSADVDDAVAAARAAFPRWKQLPAHKRGEMLLRLAQIAQRREDELATFISREHGKTLFDAHGDVQELIHVALYYSAEGRRQFGTIAPSEKLGKRGFATREPLGVVLALTPWNFPFTKPALKCFPALVLGNTVILKPASETPLIGALVAELAEEAGFPPGVFNLVQGSSTDIGDHLIQHKDIDLISYTGSTPVGRRIATAAGANLVPVSLELTAKNALIVNSDANIDLALDWAVLSAFATNGQRETAASRIILLDDIADTFTERLLDRVGHLTIGDPLINDPYIGPLISEQQRADVEQYVSAAIEHGGRILTGGKRPSDPKLAHGFFFEPTVISDVMPSSDPAQEETFGPVTMLFRVKTVKEAVDLANSTRYGLSMAIFTTNIDVAMSTVDQLECGVAWINAGTAGAEVGLQFGGTKDTGIGRTEWGQGALDTFSRWKTTYINYSGQYRMVFEDTRFEV